MDKKIKVQVPSSSGEYFIDVDLTEKQNNFLNKFNQIVDKKLYDFFDTLTDEIAATSEYKNINKSELFQLYHDIPGAIWSGAALTTLLPRFYGKKMKMYAYTADDAKEIKKATESKQKIDAITKELIRLRDKYGSETFPN